MKIRVQLAEADRERYGAPEWLEVDPRGVTAREMVILQKGVDIDGAICSYDSVQDWGDALVANLKNEKGADAFAWLVLAWLGLRRVGVTVPLAGMDVAKMQVELEGDPVDPQEPGKDLSTPETTS